MTSSLSRRRFIKRTGQAAIGVKLLSYAGPAWAVSPNEKLNIAMIGTANQARYDLDNVASQNIVALCDIDENLLNAASQKYTSAQKFADYRKALELKEVDAVVIGTPDHTHAVITAAALHSGRHAYCEKPLARSIGEVRKVTELARQKGLTTQIGTQIHGGDNYRRVVELIQGGAIGSVSEVHVWVGGGFGGKKRSTATPPVPKNINYDLWLGPVEYRPYEPEYLPFYWRDWWVFGGGTLADLGCHHVDLSHWALGIRAPRKVRVVDGPKPDPECPPTWLIVEYEYARPSGTGGKATEPIKLTWYHGDKRPHHFADGQLPKWGNGTLFVGTKGMLLADYDRHVLLPQKAFAGFQAPAPFIPKSIGHHKEWIEACKGRGKPLCNFDYSGPLTEAVLLGNVAFRTGKELEWDAKNMRAKNAPEADEFIQYKYREGWSL
ncbi:MAG TPA: Gfo/Idh/MocA family oxidoreductase [Candidatus Limnocylindria bacterium]|jgi:predicted dehydrogenase|nr:Gfo/Idh/MocA family oxidoreductase [Candidatus Limnocylindria bacterium]